ncbi:MAG: DUF2290 domain-containing protein [Gilliamella sp.]|nr:DUF2290 domain-containing protein [Gilliamella sp.]
MSKDKKYSKEICNTFNQIDQIIGILYRLSLSSGANQPVYKPSRNKKGSILSIEIPKFLPEYILDDIFYQEMWIKMNKKRQYSCKMIDGGLITFLYTFDLKKSKLIKSRLSYFPSYDHPIFDSHDNFEGYIKDYIYLDAFTKTSYPAAFRFDYDASAAKDIIHPASHFTLGQFENCRIPVYSPLTPFEFMDFVIRNFYNKFYSSWNDEIKKVIKKNNFKFKPTITNNEKKLIYLNKI